MGGACDTHRIGENAYKILFRKSEEKKQIGRHRRIWEDNNGMDLREIE
jgi:hypothetical protein